MAGPIVDLFMVYQFIKKLTTPFAEWDAAELGIIDGKGVILKKRKELRTVKERNAFGHMDHLVLNIKKIMEKVPGGNTRLGSYAAALWLIKEGETLNAETLTEESVEAKLQTYMEQADSQLEVEEDAPVTNTGNVAGLTADSEPGMSKKAQRKYKMKQTVGKRVPKGAFFDGKD